MLDIDRLFVWNWHWVSSMQILKLLCCMQDPHQFIVCRWTFPALPIAVDFCYFLFFLFSVAFSTSQVAHANKISKVANNVVDVKVSGHFCSS